MPAEKQSQTQQELRERIARFPVLVRLVQVADTELASVRSLIETTHQRFEIASQDVDNTDVSEEEALSVPQTLEAIYNDARVSDASLEVALVLLEQRDALFGEGKFRDLTQELAEDASLAEQHKAIEDTLAPLFEAAKQPYKGHAEVNPEIDEVVKNLRMTFKKEEDAYPPRLDEVLSKAQADIAFTSAEALEGLSTEKAQPEDIQPKREVTSINDENEVSTLQNEANEKLTSLLESAKTHSQEVQDCSDKVASLTQQAFTIFFDSSLQPEERIEKLQEVYDGHTRVEQELIIFNNTSEQSVPTDLLQTFFYLRAITAHLRALAEQQAQPTATGEASETALAAALVAPELIEGETYTPELTVVESTPVKPQPAPATKRLPRSRFLFTREEKPTPQPPHTITPLEATRVGEAHAGWVRGTFFPEILPAMSTSELITTIRDAKLAGDVNKTTLEYLQNELADRYADQLKNSTDKAAAIVQQVRDSKVIDTEARNTLLDAAGIIFGHGALDHELGKAKRDIQLFRHTQLVARAAVKQWSGVNPSMFTHHVNTASENYLHDIHIGQQAIESINLLHMSSEGKTSFAKDIQLHPRKMSTRRRRLLNLGIEQAIAKVELHFSKKSELLLKGSEVLLAAYDPEFRAPYKLPEGFEKTLQAILTKPAEDGKVNFTIGDIKYILSHSDAKSRIAVAYAALTAPSNFIYYRLITKE